MPALKRITWVYANMEDAWVRARRCYPLNLLFETSGHIEAWRRTVDRSTVDTKTIMVFQGPKVQSKRTLLLDQITWLG